MTPANPMDSDLPVDLPLEGRIEGTVAALRGVFFGSPQQQAVYGRVRDVILGMADAPPSGLTCKQEARIAPQLLRKVLTELGMSASDIACDTYLRGALYEWSAIAAPKLLTVLPGHLDMAIGSILILGNGSAYQRACLAELDTGTAIGALVLTELGGTNGANQQTIASWDPTTGGFLLSTPTAAACKFFSTVADPDVPKTVVVTARLIADGRDEGVLPFLLKLRTRSGLADGANVVPLPDKNSAQMDHAMIRFDRVWVPREALLGGDFAQMSAEGRLECSLPHRARFHAAMNALGEARLDLAQAAAASARAALAGLVNYAMQRRPGAGRLMADRDAVQRDLVSAVASAYATGALGRNIRDMRAFTAPADSTGAVWSVLAKSLLSNSAHEVLMMCRRHAAEQGLLRINHIVDWMGNVDAIITGEGDNQTTQVSVGKREPALLAALQLPGTPTRLPWFVDMLIARERTIAAAVDKSKYKAVGTCLGPDAAAVELATATAERLAVVSLILAENTMRDRTARKLVVAAAAVYALERIYAHGTWYAAHKLMSPRRADDVVSELHRYRLMLLSRLPAMASAFNIPALPGPIFTADYVRSWQRYAGWSDRTFVPVPASQP